MSNLLDELERQRHATLEKLVALGDMRPGQLVPIRNGATGGGSTNGVAYQLTASVGGRMVSRELPDGPLLERARRELFAYGAFQLLAKQLVEINEKICETRYVQESASGTAGSIEAAEIAVEAGRGGTRGVTMSRSTTRRGAAVTAAKAPAARKETAEAGQPQGVSAVRVTGRGSSGRRKGSE
jgi:hypothetical protein